ncbi:MAG: hypothetical protein WKF63_10785, partial [Thermomicrobiales bacterium]
MPASIWTRAACIMCVALVWSIQYPFWPNRESLLDQGKLVDYSWLAFATWAGGLVVWLWAMWALLSRFRGHSFTEYRLLIGVATAVIYASFTAMYPTNAID